MKTIATIPIDKMEEQCVNFCIQYVHNSLPKMCYLVKVFMKDIRLSWDQHSNYFSFREKNMVQTKKVKDLNDNICHFIIIQNNIFII